MSRSRIHLSYSKELVKQPIIYEIGRNFNVITNILRANINTESGWVDLELIGEDEEIAKAMEDLEGKGVQIDREAGGSVEK